MEYSFYMMWAIGVVLLASFFAFRRFISNKSTKTPHDLLQGRYDAGEITIYEYEQQKRQLYREEDLKIKMFFLASLSKD